MSDATFDIIGRIGQIKATERGSGNVAFYIDIASKKSWKPKESDKWEERTYWHTVTLYEGSELLAKKLEIGDFVRFQGEITTWMEKNDDGSFKRSGIVFKANSRRILARAKDKADQDIDGQSVNAGNDDEDAV
jgi:single-stranded DNA-binding protein